MGNEEKSEDATADWDTTKRPSTDALYESQLYSIEFAYRRMTDVS